MSKPIGRMKGSGKDVTIDPTPEVIQRYFHALDTPVALSCYMLYRYGEHEQLARKTINPHDYASSESFYLDYLAVRFLTKFTGLVTGIDTTEVATDEFVRCERKCHETNERLTDLFVEDPLIRLTSDKEWRFSRIVSWLGVKISNVVGCLDLDEIYDACDFGPGATTRVGGTKTSAYEKFRGTPHSTRGALPYALDMSERWDNFFHRFDVVDGNKVTFVPKNAKTDRPIAMEPCVNSFLQHGAGVVLARRLLHFGVDIRDQKRNQQLACRGSRFGDLATVDLKSASDLISHTVVELLLPPDWYGFLNSLRSRQFHLNGATGTYAKFSSMGNGFTFPLQTLIFWAFAKLSCKVCSVDSHHASAYGDDIIVPTGAYEVFCTLLDLFGFEVNKAKSFADSQFRESCGADFFNGADCQPLYLKEPLLDEEAMELVKFANRLRRLSVRSLAGYACDRRFESLWQYVTRLLPRRVRRLRIPEGYGDGGLMLSFEEACPQRAPGGLEGYLYDHLVFVPLTYEMVDSDGTLRCALFRVGRWVKPPIDLDERRVVSIAKAVDILTYYDGLPSYGEAEHRRVGMWVRRRGVARHWPSLGGWV